MRIKKWTVINIDFNEKEEKKVYTFIRKLHARGFKDLVSIEDAESVDDDDKYNLGIQLTSIDYIKEK